MFFHASLYVICLYLHALHSMDVSICLLYFSTLHDSIVHDVCMYVCIHIYIYIYICTCACVGDCALCMTDSHGYASNRC